MLTFFSGFGQSYFFGIYNDSIRADFGLSNTVFGSIYSGITMLSAVMLMFAGKLIDRLPLPLYAAGVVCLLTLACLLMGVAGSLLFLVLAMFLLRFSGQGLMTHTASTSMSRYFDKTRGRAIAIGNLGFSLGAVVLPLLAVRLLDQAPWQQNYMLYALCVALGVLPLVLWLLKGHAVRHATWQKAQDEKALQNPLDAIDDWTRKRVLKDWRFYLVLPGIMAEALVNTGVHFYLGRVADAKNWPMEVIATSLSVQAVAAVSFTIMAGLLVDRMGSLKLLPFIPLPLCIGLFVLAGFDHFMVAYIYMFLSGLGKGFLGAAGTALWAEFYGVKHIGSIKSLVMMVTVLSTAVMPPLLGYLFDQGVSMDIIATGLGIYVFMGALLTLPVARSGKKA